MKNNLYKKSLIIDMKSQWVGESLVRVVTRKVGNRDKILVDVTEHAPETTSRKTAQRLAMEAARRVGCGSVDSVTLSDQEIVRRSFKINTDEPVSTKVRTMTFAFDAE